MIGQNYVVQPASLLMNIPEEQFVMPAGFSQDGAHMLSLKEIAEAREPFILFASMSPEQKAALVARRIEMQPKFEVAMIGAGLISKERAIDEVKAQSEVGQKLIEIEQRLLKRLIEQIQRKELASQH